MIGVADTSPISALLRIGRLPILTDLFDSTLIPAEVAAELDGGKHILGEWRSCAGASQLSVRTPANQAFVRQLSAALHRGEAAAIALTTEIEGAMLVIDDREGRDTARRLGLPVTGTLGVVVAAKRRGLLPAAAPVIAALHASNALWLSDAIVRHALA